ncbi:Hydrogenase nickel incorporation protein HypB [Thermodesulfobium acidiphilum]|uniref:Hydrogenase nickel incorporation protein HypB n=1 Tax=Thermodesulfobium acidiphilum TaxID=1794699 RepID=A0A2R4VZT8_THEAF|nr:hydrogenase nickel incorporation protein HypB [Thermodesulfobium acidiphilum]AWB10057.1 Hydrogenase nickel incorporation protein HypB [Thermodesulfobium acidiphilum]PMP86806.1 MAG: hydrogenase accessory protein HypB [Thermodesulfobium narugense]
MELKDISVNIPILSKSVKEGENNKKIFESKKLLTINLISSPGSGKTTLLENITPILNEKGFPSLVIEGDIATTRDAERINKKDIKCVQINTHGICHLESKMIRKAFEQFNVEHEKILFIENVGNLVCPAEFYLGEHEKVAILSVTEGEDKPEKYPLLFKEASCILLTKVDLLPFLDLSEEVFISEIRKLNKESPIFLISKKNKNSYYKFVEWLIQKYSSIFGEVQ